MTEDELHEFRAKAEAATPGPWRVRVGGSSDWVESDVEFYDDNGNDGHRVLPHSRANAAFIAAANPQTALRLLDEVSAVRKAFREYGDGERRRCTAACPPFAPAPHPRSLFHSCRLPAKHDGPHLWECETERLRALEQGLIENAEGLFILFPGAIDDGRTDEDNVAIARAEKWLLKWRRAVEAMR